MKLRTSQGFTLIELLIVIALIAVLAGAVIIALNPARQFAQARNSERWSHISAISSAIQQNITENKGNWTCAAGPIPTTSTVMALGGGYNICSCLVPNQAASLPIDPSGSGVGASYTDCTAYNTGYNIIRNASTGQITVSSTHAELDESISLTR